MACKMKTRTFYFQNGKINCDEYQEIVAIISQNSPTKFHLQTSFLLQEYFW